MYHYRYMDNMSPVRDNKTTLSIPTEVTRKARAKAIIEGANLSAVVTLFLRAWLAGEIDLPTPEKAQPKRKRGGDASK